MSTKIPLPAALRPQTRFIARQEPGPSQNTVSRPLLRRRSKSAVDIKPRTKPALLKKINEVPKVVKPGQKRPALQNNDENKPKVAKRIPDWDYKSRFQDLQKKFATIQDQFKESKEELCATKDKIKDSQVVVEELKLVCSVDNEFSEKTPEALVAFVKSLKRKLNDLKRLCQEEAQWKKEKTELEAKCKKIISDIEILVKEKNQLFDELASTQNELDHKTQQFNTVSTYNDDLEKQVEELSSRCSYLEELAEKQKVELLKQDDLRRNLHNTVQDLKGNIRVFCRVRPPLPTQESTKDLCSMFFPNENTLQIRQARESRVDGSSMDLKQEFSFDKVFAPAATQEEVFEELSHLVQSALDGYHVCVFAYGQTGSGKTYTMQGTPEQLGMIPRSIELIFEKIDMLAISGWTYTVAATFLEIYNENIRDLLVPNDSGHHDLRFNEGRGVTVSNLREVHISSAKELKALMEEAQKNRAVAATNYNEHSSRSHAVTKISLEGCKEGDRSKYCGSINLVDLAGSESAKTSTTERLTETKNINKSLATLGNVMMALHNKDSHIPYRDSKLTFLLQSSLGGNSKTLMFVNISPFEECFSESIHSLRFASKVKEVKTVAKKIKTFEPGFLTVKGKSFYK